MTQEKIKELIALMGFLPVDGKNKVYSKKYPYHNNYIITIDFNKKIGNKSTGAIEYRPENMSKSQGITWDDLCSSNFSKDENFVVLECVNRLLEMKIPPQNIILEKKYPTGTSDSRPDIIVTEQNSRNTYLLIECKTYGKKYDIECKQTLQKPRQIFSYYSLDRSSKFLCLYTSKLDNGKIIFKDSTIATEPIWKMLNTAEEIHNRWNKNFETKGIFSNNSIYNIDSRLLKGDLEILEKDNNIFKSFLEILRHNVISDKPNAFNKILNLLICKIYDEDKDNNVPVDFFCSVDGDEIKLQKDLNDLYKKGMKAFFDIDVTDFTDDEINEKLKNIDDAPNFDTIKSVIDKLRLQKNPEFAFIEVYDDKSFEKNAKVVKEVVRLLQKYKFRYEHKQQFLGDFFEQLLQTSIKQESGQYFTPIPITHFIINSLPIEFLVKNKIENKNESDVLPYVIDFACGTGHFLTEYIDNTQLVIDKINEKDIKATPTIRKKIEAWKTNKYDWAKEYVYGIEADYRLIKAAKVNCFLNGDGQSNMIRGNGLDCFVTSDDYIGKLKKYEKNNEMYNQQFDLLISNPPFSINGFKSTIPNGERSFDLFNNLTDNSNEIECLFIERMNQLLKIGGMAGIILPNTILTNDKNIQKSARKIILEHFKIKAIVELPSNAFMDANIKTVIMFLEKRDYSEYKCIKKATEIFLKNQKDVTVLGIENIFSIYVKEQYEDLSFNDYISLIKKAPTSTCLHHSFYTEYLDYFEEKEDLYDQIISVEKNKIIYFILTYTYKSIIVTQGDKINNKLFLGYEFRKNDGLHNIPNAGILYDDGDIKNPKKINSYIYYSFLNDEKFEKIDNELKDNLTIKPCYKFIDFSTGDFTYKINLITKILNFNNNYTIESINRRVDLIKGVTYDKSKQVHNPTSNIILTADNITQNNEFEIKKKIYLTEEFNIKDDTKLKKDDIFVCTSSGSSNHVGKVAYITQNTEYFAGGYMSILRKKQNILGTEKDISMEYLYEILSSNTVRFFVGHILSKGMGIQNLNSKISHIKIPFPPKSIQDEIVHQIKSSTKDKKESILQKYIGISITDL